MQVTIERGKNMTKSPSKPRKRLRRGDILELRSSSGRAYLHFLGRTADYGDAVLVLPRWFDERPNEFLDDFFRNGYPTYYPAHASVWHGLTEIVGTIPLAQNVDLFANYRRRGARNRQGQVLAWVVVRDGVETLQTELSDEDRKLPIASVWNHEFLIDKINKQWRPEQAG